MKVESTKFKDYLTTIETKRLIAFGATIFMQVMADNYQELNLAEKVDYVVDNDPGKDGTTYDICGESKPVHSLQYLLKDNLEDIVILLGSDAYSLEMFEQLEAIPELRDVPCFCLPLMIMNRIDDDCSSLGNLGAQRIPKIIHCFWFSGDEKDELSRKCIESWKTYCPDYEIKEWNTKNYDVTKNKYMYEAYKARKWAYVTDYARSDMVHTYGGFYFDLDLELLKSIDSLLGARFVTGFGPIRDVELAAFGAEKGSEMLGRILDAYEDRTFDGDKPLTLKDVQPVFMDSFMKNQGFLINGRLQNIDGNIILPRDSFSPRNWFTGEPEVKETSFGIHYCAGGWSSRGAVLRKYEAMKKLADTWNGIS